MTSRPRALVISHTYVVAANRCKFDTLSKFADIALLVPTHWRDTMGDIALDPIASESTYKLFAAGTIFNGRVARYFYSPGRVLQIFRTFRPSFVHLEEEPWGMSFLQVALLKHLLHFRLCFFTWENIAHRPTPIERFNLASADAAIAGNVDACHVLRSNGFSRSIWCIPQLGIDIPTRAATPGPHSRFRIGYVGRLVAEKGLLDLFEALRNLPGNWEISLVGDGPLRDSLRQLADQYGFAQRACFVGAVPHEAVVEHLRTCDVLVLPSLTTLMWKEQFGHVLIEAMAQAIPVIGSNSGAIPEVIADAGVTVPERNPQALAKALQDLMADEARRVELGRRGNARARSRYSHEEVGRQTWAVWQRLMHT